MSPFERLVKTITNPFFILVYFGLIILLILKLDKHISAFFFHANIRSSFPYLSYLTRVGLGAIYFPAFLIFALFFRYVRKNRLWEVRFWFLMLCLIVPSIVSLILKISLGRARPNLFLQGSEQFYGFYGWQTQANFWSFPSGHTTTIIGVVLGLGILFPRYFVALMLLGASVAISRVLLTHHYLSDVLFSMYLTTMVVFCLLTILKRKSWLTLAWKPRF
ncbi:MAG: phosphatase PAP2 family protein [Tatlockia sp.]|nr:phosphatase PAP2 family protein [Tatlockia sp.]